MTVVVAALTGTLALAMQVRRVLVTGTSLFPGREVEEALASALGERVIAISAEELRERTLAVPWVAEAMIRLSLDGTVSCQVTERAPMAVELDGGARQLVDAAGRLLGDHEAGGQLLELRGFAPYPAERGKVLAAASQLERFWGGRLVSIERLGARDVALGFADTPFVVLADPAEASLLATARAVTAAWTVRAQVPPQRVDARVPGRVALLPAPAPAPSPEGQV
jgi:cell division septal protein FtsQ